LWADLDVHKASSGLRQTGSMDNLSPRYAYDPKRDLQHRDEVGDLSMPAPQLHLTFAEELAREAALADELRAAAVSEPRYLRLGSIFHDLAYYGNMPLMAIRYGLRRPAEPSVWGYRIHYDRPDVFLACFVEAAHELEAPLTCGERLAVIAGLCSHAALDLSLHPLVNFIARRDCLSRGGAESHHHRLAEKYHALFYHLDVYGRDVIGSVEMRDKTRITKRSSVLRRAAEPAIVDLALAAYQKMWGDAPSRADWTGWVRSFSQFGMMVGYGLGGWMSRRNSLKLRTVENREHYFQSRDFDFYDFMKAARRRVIDIANRAHAYFAAGDFSPAERTRFVSEIAFDGTLAEPLGAHGPRLPDAPAAIDSAA
jgi:hypothetical protein